jgi:hypothetical protein
MANLHLIIEGTEANKAADQLKTILGGSGADAIISPISPAALPNEVRRVIDPLTLIGVILAIPGAVLSAKDLADRILKRKKAQTLIDAATQMTTVQVNIVMPDGAIRQLAQLTPDEVLEVADKQIETE